MKGIYLYYLAAVLLTLLCCKKKPEKSKSDSLIFPIGRSFLDSGEITLTIGGTEHNPNIIFDSCGGYWLKISRKDLPESGNITINYTKRNGEFNSFKEIVGNKQDWLMPSYYIDSDNNILISKAIELTNNLQSNVDKAKEIHQFVINHVILKNYKDSFLDKASKTYESGYGTCINFSRLYVALCRAVGIPARTIWGIVYGHNDDNIYDYHHQWAEILDDSGYWHPCDFNYTTIFDLNDIRYLDLIYAAEENTIIKERVSQEFLLKNLTFFNDYPVSLTGRFGFELLEDNRPNSMTVEYIYEFQGIFSVLRLGSDRDKSLI